MVQIELNRVGDDYHMVAANEEGVEVHLDAASTIGGTGKGMRPMQLLLSSLACCASIDVISILKKQKQVIDTFKVKVDGLREEGAEPSPYKKIHMHFVLSGKIDESKLAKAVSLSVEKYCSVLASLNDAIEVTYDSEVLNQ